MKKFFRQNWWVILVFILAHLAQFWPFYFQRLLPFPGDMLVAFHFPWSGGGWDGFDSWTQYKALNTVDAIKQFYPWKVFAFDLLRQGIWPLWNPYSFSGMPFIANLQSGLFFPTNIIYFFVPVLWGWTGNIFFQLLLFGVFSYLFLRSQGLSRLAASFGGVVLMNLSYVTLWHWQLVITQSVLFLPLILYFVNRRNLLFVSLLLALCFLGGHAQTTVYVYLIFIFFALYRRVSWVKILLTSLFPIALAAIQILPSVETYLQSAREGVATKELFAPFIFHWKNIITVLAPDFFGHPTTRNYTGTDYRDMNAYFGVTAFIFSLISLNFLKQKNSIRFFLFLAIFGLLLAAFPLVFIFDILNVPILSSGVPARMIFVFQFAAGILSAYGFEYWWQKKPRLLFPLGVVGLVLASLWVLGGSISRSNLILPTALYFLTGVFLLLRRKIAVAAIFILLFFQYSYFFNKYNSFSPQKFVFPSHPVLTYLQKNAGIDRFSGTEQAIFNQNFSVFYRLFDFKGYDSVYPKRYGQLIASVETATVPEEIPRSDAYIKHWSDRQSERLLDLLGVKYLLDKNDLLTGEWDEEPSRFAPQRYQLLWQHRPWRIYQRKTALPRIALFDGFDVETNDSRIIAQLYDVNFDYKNKLILRETPSTLPQPTSQKNVDLISYQPNEIQAKTQSDKPQLLFLSDNFYPGWKAIIDGRQAKILRANYAFRAVALPSGEHQIIFVYDPGIFKAGAGVSLVSLGLFLFLWSKKSFRF